MAKRILIVEDDWYLAEILLLKLSATGYQVKVSGCGLDGLRAAYEFHPDLVLLDIMLPDISGFEVCRRLRELSDMPILMLTALTAHENVLEGFRSGADDYIKKPFESDELLARICACLRRAEAEDGRKVYDDGRLRIDLEAGQVYRDGERVHLSPTEFRLLRALVSRVGCVVSHRELLEEVWGEAYRDAVPLLSLYVRYLREKIEEYASKPEYIRTEWGRGYWFNPMIHSERAPEEAKPDKTEDRLKTPSFAWMDKYSRG